MLKKILGLTLSPLLFALCASVAAQQPKKVARIGYLATRSEPVGRKDSMIKSSDCAREY